MNAIFEDAVYARLQRQMHDALLAQNPDWILPNGDCPTGDVYDARFAELLIQLAPGHSCAGQQEKADQFQYQFQPPTRVGTTHHIYEKN